VDLLENAETKILIVLLMRSELEFMEGLLSALPEVVVRKPPLLLLLCLDLVSLQLMFRWTRSCFSSLAKEGADFRILDQP